MLLPATEPQVKRGKGTPQWRRDTGPSGAAAPPLGTQDELMLGKVPGAPVGCASSPAQPLPPIIPT